MKADTNFQFLPLNDRGIKPRTAAITEIRGPYYSAPGASYFDDLFEAYGWAIDTFKFGAGSFTLMRDAQLRRLIERCHQHQITVSTGGFLEWVLVKSPHLLDQYLQYVAELGFDVVEVSNGYIAASIESLIHVVDRAQKAGLEVKPEINVQFGAGGGVATPAELASEGPRDVQWAIHTAERYLERDVKLLMVESEGITENVDSWATDVVAALVASLGLDRLMFEAADPRVFAWYIKTFGTDVNLFIDHSQIVQLESIRSGTWAESSLFGRVVVQHE